MKQDPDSTKLNDLLSFIKSESLTKKPVVEKKKDISTKIANLENIVLNNEQEIIKEPTKDIKNKEVIWLL